VGLGRGRSLEAMQLDTKRTFDELVERFAGSRERRDRILGNAFYRRIADTLGGTHEYMAMEKLHQLAEEETHDAIVIDTPPTRSALSFLDAPGRLTDFLGGRLLRWMLRPSMGAGRLTLGAARLGATAFLHAAGRLVGSAALADLAEFLAAFEGMFGGFEERAGRVVELLRSDGCAFLVVTAPAGPSLEEAGFFLDRLAQGGMRAGPVVVNRWRPAGVILPGRAARASSKLAGGGLEDRAAAAVLDCRLRRAPAETEAAEAMAGFAAGHPDVSLVAVPDLSGPVLDVPGLRRVGAHLFGSGVR